MVGFVPSSLRSEPPASQIQGAKLATGLESFLPAMPRGEIFLEILIASSVWSNASQLLKALAGSMLSSLRMSAR